HLGAQTLFEVSVSLSLMDFLAMGIGSSSEPVSQARILTPVPTAAGCLARLSQRNRPPEGARPRQISGGFTPGSAVTVQMMNRISNMYGCQTWHPAMICWGFGRFGVGLMGLAHAMGRRAQACGT